MSHIIQKQILELTLNEGPNKEALKDDMAHRLKQEVLPALNDFFNELIPENTIWKIDKLELDLGQVKPENFSKELIRQLRQKLKPDIEPVNGEKALEIISSKQGVFEQFLYFLKHGHFSWNANGATLSQMEAELPALAKELEKSQRVKLVKGLSEKASLERFEKQFSLKFQLAIALELIPTRGFKRLFRFLEKSLPAMFFAKMPAIALSAYSFNPDIKRPENFLVQLLNGLEYALGFSAVAKEEFRKELLAKAKVEDQKTFELIEAAIQELQKQKSETSKKKEETEPTETETEPTDRIYIKNAGMVLLWPYLERFFENLKLVSNGEFISRKAREKAVCLLQSLVDPESEIAENQLPLNKILCGMDVAELVPTAKVEISDEDLAAEDELLEAVISNWSKIGNTSVQGFQTSFMQREGRMENTEEGWKLLVEQRSFDVLLDSLPWNITLIKLPWMPKPLHVEW